MDAAFGVVDVLPLECAALTAPHSSCDDELEVGFVQDAHGLQRLNQLFHRFIVRDFLFLLLPSVFVGAPRRVVIQIAALHRVGENAAQTAVDTFYRCFGERLSVGYIFLLAQLCVETAEVFGAQIDQLVAAEVRFETLDVLFLAHECRLRQLVRCNRLEPDFGVPFECDRPVNGRVQLLAGHLEQHCLLLKPFFRLLWGKTRGRLDRFLLRIAPPAVGRVTHGHYNEITVSTFSDTCHL